MIIKEEMRGGKSGVVNWEEGRETREDALLHEDDHHGTLRGCEWGRMKETRPCVMDNAKA